jgi:hypothetical protein
MKHSGESLQGTYGGPWPEDANVPVTERAGISYLHFLPGFKDTAEVKATSPPKSVRLLRTGDQLQSTFDDGVLGVTVPGEARTDLPDVVVVSW